MYKTALTLALMGLVGTWQYLPCLTPLFSFKGNQHLQYSQIVPRPILHQHYRRQQIPKVTCHFDQFMSGSHRGRNLSMGCMYVCMNWMIGKGQIAPKCGYVCESNSVLNECPSRTNEIASRKRYQCLPTQHSKLFLHL